MHRATPLTVLLITFPLTATAAQHPTSADAATQAVVTRSQQIVDSLRSLWDSVRATTEGVNSEHAKLDSHFRLTVQDSGTVVHTDFAGLDECAGDSLATWYTSVGNVRVRKSHSDYYVLAESFAFGRGIESGMTTREVTDIMGAPMRQTGTVLTFGVLDWGALEYDDETIYRENIRMFFREGGLRYVWLHYPTYSC